MDQYNLVDFINKNYDRNIGTTNVTLTIDVIYSCIIDNKDDQLLQIEVKYLHINKYKFILTNEMTIKKLLKHHEKNAKIIKIYTFNDHHRNDTLHKSYSNPDYSYYKIDYKEIKKYIAYYQIDFMKYYLNDHNKINYNLLNSITNMTELHDDLNINNKKKLKLENKINPKETYENVIFDNDILNESCPVCTEKYIDNIDDMCCLLCNHLICLECVKKIKKSECPMCRQEFNKSFIKPNKYLINIIKNDETFKLYDAHNTNINKLNIINEKISVINDIIKNRKISISKNKKYLECINEEINFWNLNDENSQVNFETINLNLKKRKNIECDVDSNKEKKT